MLLLLMLMLPLLLLALLVAVEVAMVEVEASPALATWMCVRGLLAEEDVELKKGAELTLNLPLEGAVV